MDNPLEDSPIAIPVISAIIEMETDNEIAILMQTRVARYDRLYSGCIKIPAGRINRFENVYETVSREVKEDTGLEIIEINPPNTSKFHRSSRKDAAFVFQPYCCQQLLKGNILGLDLFLFAR